MWLIYYLLCILTSFIHLPAILFAEKCPDCFEWSGCSPQSRYLVYPVDVSADMVFQNFYGSWLSRGADTPSPASFRIIFVWLFNRVMSSMVEHVWCSTWTHQSSQPPPHPMLRWNSIGGGGKISITLSCLLFLKVNCPIFPRLNPFLLCKSYF